MPLSTPWIRVVLDDETELRERILNIDFVALDRDRGRHRDWPSATDGPMFTATYLAWHALTRTNKIAKWPLSEFETRALQIEMEEDEESTVDPTRTGPEPE